MVYIFLADGFEETEAIAPMDILRRGGVEIQSCSITPGKREVTGAHGITMLADIAPEKLPEDGEMLILPGGMPGTTNLAADERLSALLCEQYQKGKWLAAICAAPTVLGGLGLLKNHEATCYPGMESGLSCRCVLKKSVVESGRVITSRGPGTALLFGEKLLAALKGDETAAKICEKLCCPN